jgi:hypothetical protein
MLVLKISALALGSDAVGSNYYLEPKIKQQPASQVVGTGETATFKVVMETEPDAKPIDRQFRYYDSTFQWIKDGARIEGATTATLTIKNAQPADAGVYYLAINWNRERTTSAIVTLAVVASAPPAIAAHPTGGAFARDQAVTLRVFASGAPAPKFQWYRDGREIPGATADALTFPHVQAADAGAYEVRVANAFGTLRSRSATITVIDPAFPAAPGAPAIVAEPQSLVVRPGQPAEFTVAATGAGVTYQWFRHGVALAGATAPTLAIAEAAGSDMGCYSVRATNSAGSAESQSVALAVSTGTAGRLVNLSARGHVPRGGSLTLGFTLRGAGPASLLLRAAGPALADLGVERFLPDPRLALQAVGHAAALLSNDNWEDGSGRERVAAAATAAGAFAFRPASRDAALVATLTPETGRTFTVQATAADTSTEGVVLSELYDLAGPDDAVRLESVSLLAWAGADERTLAPGFTIAGAAPQRLLIRAVGPGLAAFGVADAMTDPEISVIPAGCTTPVARNSDWANDPAVATASAAAGAFPLAPDGRDAAVVATLPPGGYTLAVSGAGGASGVVLLEIYGLDP